jgi:hypothetical protein
MVAAGGEGGGMLGAGWADARSGRVMAVAASTKNIAAAIELLVAMAGRAMPAYGGMDNGMLVSCLLYVCMKLLCLMRVVFPCAFGLVYIGIGALVLGPLDLFSGFVRASLGHVFFRCLLCLDHHWHG